MFSIRKRPQARRPPPAERTLPYRRGGPAPRRRRPSSCGRRASNTTKVTASLPRNRPFWSVRSFPECSTTERFGPPVARANTSSGGRAHTSASARAPPSAARALRAFPTKLPARTRLPIAPPPRGARRTASSRRRRSASRSRTKSAAAARSAAGARRSPARVAFHLRGVRDALQPLAVRQTTTRALGGVLDGPLPVPDARELERAVRGRGVRGRHRGALAMRESDADGGGARVLEGLGVEHRAEHAFERYREVEDTSPGSRSRARTHHDATPRGSQCQRRHPRGGSRRSHDGTTG